MNRTLRGVWARRATLLPLLLLSTVVVAGVVAVIALAESTRTSPAVVVPLLVLGLVAVPDTGRHLAATRRGEIAVGRLRGVTGGQLYAVLAVEPLLVLDRRRAARGRPRRRHGRRRVPGLVRRARTRSGSPSSRRSPWSWPSAWPPCWSG